MNIGFVSTRLAGTDGVSLETRKIASILRGMGHETFFCAGELDPDLPGRLAPTMHFTHPKIVAVQEIAFSTTVATADFQRRVAGLATELMHELAQFCQDYAIDLLVPQNALTIPMNIPLGMALTDFIAKTDMPTLAHHHDFYWERERFARNCVGTILEQAFPPNLPSIRHMVINSPAQGDLKARRGIDSVVMPNIFEFERAAPGITPSSRTLRAALDLTDEHLLILQPTRVVARKGIELAIELVARLQQPQHRDALLGKQPVLVITHHAGDEGRSYLESLQAQAETAGVDLRYVGPQFAPEADPERGIFSLWDAYAHADFVTYPSLYEGFGNALVEAIYFRLPVLVNRYSVYHADIRPKGFDFVEIDGAITDEAVDGVIRAMMDPVVRRRMVEHNYEVAKRHFSYTAVQPILADLLADLVA